MTRMIGQPFEGMRNLHEELVEMLNDPRIRRFYAVTAWAKRSGISRLAADLISFRRRGGTAVLLVGIDEGGATQQGLRLALDLFDRVDLLHDRAARTFHPKLYLGVGPVVLRGYVGSGNLTAGGLYANYELGLSFTTEMGDSGAALGQQIRRYVARLYRDRDTRRQLTAANIEAVIADPAYRVGDEDKRRSAAELDASPDVSAPARGSRNILGFGASKQEMRRAPATSGRSRPSRTTPPLSRRKIRSSRVAGGIVERWFKALSSSDAQRARAGSNPTGNLRLAQARHDIDHTTYFRFVLFGGEKWRKEKAPNGILDVTDVKFDVRAGVRSLGMHTLRVDHGEFRVAGQRNIATFLHWGTLAPQLRGTNYTGRYVIIERRAAGRYRLTLTSSAPGSPM